ncbi:hypothetical protein HYU19_04900 [Candidatus Woesearchaeota archaeon]|nr:hypothetical protein [Candidatus Woesearchaeota archaeon]
MEQTTADQAIEAPPCFPVYQLRILAAMDGIANLVDDARSPQQEVDRLMPVARVLIGDLKAFYQHRTFADEEQYSRTGQGIDNLYRYAMKRQLRVERDRAKLVGHSWLAVALPALILPVQYLTYVIPPVLISLALLSRTRRREFQRVQAVINEQLGRVSMLSQPAEKPRLEQTLLAIEQQVRNRIQHGSYPLCYL